MSEQSIYVIVVTDYTSTVVQVSASLLGDDEAIKNEAYQIIADTFGHGDVRDVVISCEIDDTMARAE